MINLKKLVPTLLLFLAALLLIEISIRRVNSSDKAPELVKDELLMTPGIKRRFPGDFEIVYVASKGERKIGAVDHGTFFFDVSDAANKSQVKVNWKKTGDAYQIVSWSWEE